jgi:5'-nucleotidase
MVFCSRHPTTAPPRRWFAWALLTVLLIAGSTACQTPATSTGESSNKQSANSSQRQSDNPSTASDGTVPLTLISFNDLHGNLQPPSGKVPLLDGSGDKVKAGGVGRLSHQVQSIREETDHTLVLSPGDMVGASPLISSLFHDEPTIEAMNALGLDALAVGNHEFDEGWRELVRLADGGCHPDDGCQLGDTYLDETYDGAEFPFLAANVIGPDGTPIFQPYIVRSYDGVKVGVIGLTLEGTPSLVVPSGVDDIEFRDEAETINKYISKLRANRGIEAFAIAIHQGGLPESELDDLSGCPGIKGPIVDIIERTDDAADIFLTGHTHQTYICEVDDRLATSAYSYGRLLTRVDVTLDRQSGDITDWRAANQIVRTDQPRDQVIADLVDETDKQASSVADQPVGTVAEPLSAEQDESGDIPLGEIIADAQLEATEQFGTDFAWMNPGGVRSSLEVDPQGRVTYSDLYDVQPFGNTAITLTLTGRQIHTILENQWRGQDYPRILQPSAGMSYAWHPDRPVGDRVDPDDVTIGAQPLGMDRSYRVTVNNYLAEGGDNFATFNKGTNRSLGPRDLEALSAYFDKHSPVSPVTEDRIRRIPAGD